MIQSIVFTTTQEKQLDYLHGRERYETLANPCTYEFWCKDCNKVFQFHAVCTGIDALKTHHGHNTWITTLGYMNP
jgi:hypothetical protein